MPSRQSSCVHAHHALVEKLRHVFIRTAHALMYIAPAPRRQSNRIHASRSRWWRSCAHYTHTHTHIYRVRDMGVGSRI